MDRNIFKELSNSSVKLDFTEKIDTNNFIMKLLAEPYFALKVDDIDALVVL